MLSSEDCTTFSSLQQVTSSTTTLGSDGQQETVGTVSTTENVNGDVQSATVLSREIGDDTGDAVESAVNGEVKELSNDNSSVTNIVETQTNIVKTVTENSSEKVEEIQKECRKVVENVDGKIAESCVKTERITTEQSKKVEEKIENAKTSINNIESQTKDEINAAESKTKVTINNAESQAKDAAASLKKGVGFSTKTFVSAGGRFKSPLTVTEGEKDEALYALNKIRSMHGVQKLSWNDQLAQQAKDWALQLAEDGASAELSGVDSLGEVIYVAKGTSECQSMRSAILEWYKPVTSYNYNNNNGSPVGDISLPFTQLVWEDTTDVGVSAVFREDTKTSYIVANLTPSGNYGDVRNYLKNVKQPVEGLPPKVPKPEELVNNDQDHGGDNLSNMGSLFDVLCKWCAVTDEKIEVKTSAARPFIRVVVKDEDAAVSINAAE